MLSYTIIFRAITESDLDRVTPLIRRDDASVLSAERYSANLADRQYRPEWTWIAEDVRTSEVLAVAVWWGSAAGSVPRALDAVCVHESIAGHDERVALAAELLKAGQQHFADELGVLDPPEYHVFIPADWREDPAVTTALSWRQEAAALAGLVGELERLRLVWEPADGLAKPSTRLTFHAEPDDEIFVDLLTRTLAGSLDASSTAEAAEVGAEAQAHGDVEFYRESMLGERSWWRVAVDADGEVVGFGLPSRNPTNFVVGYLGVLPEHRGRGYADDILAEITRFLADELDAEIIRADTDLVNTPMAAAFQRAGYRIYGRRLVYSAHKSGE